MSILKKIKQFFGLSPTLAKINSDAGKSGIVGVLKNGELVDIKDAGIKAGEYKTEALPDGSLKISLKEKKP